MKPANKLSNQEIITKLCDISAFFEQQDDHFIVITDEELNQPIRQHNLSFLRPHLLPPCGKPLINQVGEWFGDHDDIVLGELTSFIGLNKTYSLIAQGYISIDIDQPINKNTSLTFIREIDHETSLFTYRIAPNFE